MNTKASQGGKGLLKNEIKKGLQICLKRDQKAQLSLSFLVPFTERNGPRSSVLPQKSKKAITLCKITVIFLRLILQSLGLRGLNVCGVGNGMQTARGSQQVVFYLEPWGLIIKSLPWALTLL